MLDPDRLRAFMPNFFGYGSWTANLWFIGMEEGGPALTNERLNAWDGTSELADLRDFHKLLGGTDWFS